MPRKSNQQSSRSTRNTKKSSGRSRRGSQSTLDISQLSRQSNYQNLIRNLSSSNATKYVLGGIAGVLLVRFTMRYYREHPEISDFLRDNFENVEGRLRQYRQNLSSDTSSMARH